MPRFHLNQGASEGTWQGETPGVSFVGHTDRKVAVFEVAAGYRAAVTCVDMQHGASVTVSPEGTVEGPKQITLSSDDDILFVGFSGSVAPLPPQPITPTLSCVSPTRERRVPRALRVSESQRHRDRSCGRRAQRLHARRGQPRSAAGLPARLSDQRLRGRLRRRTTITWALTGQSVSASSSSTPCPGVLRVDKLISPEDDTGQFADAHRLRATVARAEHAGASHHRRHHSAARRPQGQRDGDRADESRRLRQLGRLSDEWRQRRRRRAGHRDVADRAGALRRARRLRVPELAQGRGAARARRGSRDHQGGQPEPRTASVRRSRGP